MYFFFNDTTTTTIYTLSLHDALPISHGERRGRGEHEPGRDQLQPPRVDRDGGEEADAERNPGAAAEREVEDRKSTRLNSSHSQISYAVFCLKKKKKKKNINILII